ncbi:MAG: hypothetical protein M1821_004535 [Bathelium mastoideum]|nr:MAG: hypothetical protein M1821_004535 [Bathelium mastoideum]
MPETQTRPARILCLDGGGVKGVATLQILEEIMTAVNQQRTNNQDTIKSQDEIKPCDYFDMICWTSTGGLIALMLGRLEFTVDDAIQKYKQLANDIFEKKKTFSWNAKYDHKPLERKLKEVISDSASPLKLNENALLIDNNRPCKSFVVTTNLTSHSAKPVLLRAYETEFEVEPINKKPVKIWEAGRATSAAPTFFGPYKMEDGLEYTDGGTIANNPTELGYQEAGRLWQGRKIDLLVSIGTEPERALALSNATEEFMSPFWLRFLKRVLPRTYFFRLQLAMYSVTAMTNTGRTHERVQDNINTFQGITSTSAAATPFSRIYFRLNIEDQSALVQLDACDKMDHLMELAKDYISLRNQERDQIATILSKTEVSDQDGLALPPARSAVADDFGNNDFLFETLMTMVEKGNAAAVKMLLERGANANTKDYRGRTPLLLAAQQGSEVITQHLLGAGKVDVDPKDVDGRTSLSRAAQEGHKDIVQLLLETDSNVDVDSKDVFGLSPSLWAVQNGHKDIVQLLLNTGKIDINSKDEYGQTLLSLAAQNGHKEIVQLFLNTDKIDIDLKDKNSQTPFLLAVKEGDKDVVQLLLDTGKVDIDSKDKNSQTPLSLAAQNGDEDIVQLLLDTGTVDVDSKDIDGQTPFSLAVEARHKDVVQLLLNTGKVDINSKDRFSQTALSKAVITGFEDVVQLLLDAGEVDVDLKDNFGRTPLSYAAIGEDTGIVQLLLDTGKVSIDLKDNDGRTPLSRAAGQGDKDVVQLLRDTGKVDINAKDNYGRTPLRWADKEGHKDVIRLLSNSQDARS